MSDLTKIDCDQKVSDVAFPPTEASSHHTRSVD